MIFDDHDVHDDWNTSEAWVEEMRKPWWQERITSALSTYWIYQHLGNQSPAALERDEVYRDVRDADDAGPVLREFAAEAEREGAAGCGASPATSAARAWWCSTAARGAC